MRLRCLTTDGATIKLWLKLFDVKRNFVRLHFELSTHNFCRVKMSHFEPNKRHLRELLIKLFNLKISAGEIHRLHVVRLF